MAVPRRIPKGDAVTWALRAELRRVDRELVAVLAERLGLVQRLWAHKGTVGLPLEDRDQERRVVTRAQRTASQRGLRATFVGEIFRAVIAEGKRAAAPALRARLRAHAPAVGSRSRRTA